MSGAPDIDIEANLSRAEALAHALVLDKGFSPISQLMPAAASAALGFDACLAVWDGENFSVVALWADRGGAPPLAGRVDGLVEALRVAEGQVSGRIRLGLVVVSGRPMDAEDETAMAGLVRGHFLARTVAQAAWARPDEGLFAAVGKWEGEPGAAWFVKALAGPLEPRGLEAQNELIRREVEALQERRWLRLWRRPWATWALIAACSAWYLAGLWLETRTGASGCVVPAAAGGFHTLPRESCAALALGAGNRERVLAFHEWWRLGGALFVHFGLMHLLANMVSLHSLGGLYERMAGSWRLLRVYFVGGLAGSLASLANAPVESLGGGATTLLLCGGASGAILAVAGALMALRWRRPEGCPATLAGRIHTKLIWPVGLILAVGAALALSPLPLRFDNWAHLGGLASGLALGLALPPAGRASTPADAA